MQKQLSVSIDEKTIKLVDEIVATGKFRNKSHAVEQGLIKLVEGRE